MELSPDAILDETRRKLRQAKVYACVCVAKETEREMENKDNVKKKKTIRLLIKIRRLVVTVHFGWGTSISGCQNSCFLRLVVIRFVVGHNFLIFNEIYTLKILHMDGSIFKTEVGLFRHTVVLIRLHI
jgi:hypothetical protein